VIFLLVNMPVATDRELERGGEGIDHRDAHTVQAARDLVGAVVELAPGVEHGHDHLGGGSTLFRVDVDGNPASIVGDRDRLIRVDLHGNSIAKTRQRFVD